MEGITGMQLLQKIKAGEIKENTRIKDNYGNELIYQTLEDKKGPVLYNHETGEILKYLIFLDDDRKFTILLNEVKEIEIQKIKPVDFITTGGKENIPEFIEKTNRIVSNNFYKVNDIINNQNKIIDILAQFDKRILKCEEGKQSGN